LVYLDKINYYVPSTHAVYKIMMVMNAGSAGATWKCTGNSCGVECTFILYGINRKLLWSYAYGTVVLAAHF